MTAEAYGPTSCPSALVPESELSHRSEAQYGLVPRLRHHGGKNIAYAEKQFFSYAPVYLKENVFNVFAFGDFKARSAAMVVMMDDENSFSIRHQQQQRKS